MKINRSYNFIHSKKYSSTSIFQKFLSFYLQFGRFLQFFVPNQSHPPLSFSIDNTNPISRWPRNIIRISEDIQQCNPNNNTRPHLSLGLAHPCHVHILLQGLGHACARAPLAYNRVHTILRRGVWRDAVVNHAPPPRDPSTINSIT